MRLQTIVSLYREDKLSKSLGHEFRSLLREWHGPDEAVRPLALAIATKKRAREEAKGLLDHVTGRESLDRLMQQLFVARPFARAAKEAYE